MTCRESKLTSALTTIARSMTGLEDNQVLGLSHSLQDEVPVDSPTPTIEEWNAFIDETIASYEAGRFRVSSGSTDPRRRLNLARQETPDARRFYAAQRIVTRCERALSAQQEYLSDYSRDTGSTTSNATEVFERYYTEATQNRQLRPSREFAQEFLRNPDNSGRFTDRRSLYAYERMNNERNTRMSSQPTRSTVQRQPVTASGFISELGYDSNTGRLEIVMHSNPDRVYAYRIPQETYDELITARSLGSYYSRNIRGNSEYLYSTMEEAANDGVQFRCPSCGQWASQSAHACPTIGSEENIDADIRAAIARARGQEVQTNNATQLTNIRTRRYPNDFGTLRSPTFNVMRQAVSREGNILAPIQFATVDGNTVRGLVQVSREEDAYVASPVTEPGTSGRENLQCTCAEYRRRYRCIHVDAVLVSLNAQINEQEAPTFEQIQQSLATVTGMLQQETTHAETLARISAGNWVPVSSSFEDDPEIFQEMYAEARRKRAEYKQAISEGNTANVEYPIPYYTENAFGGLAQRGSGRGFGTEIEFSFPDDMPWDEMAERRRLIGRDLYRLELTNNPQQQPDKASAGWFRDNHNRGWAYETDGSVNGGEVISPVMYDEPETWETLSKVCEILERHGAVPSRHAGLHVHVGNADYDHDISKHNRLLSGFHENEDLLYRLSANPETGRHRGGYYCRPNNQPSSPYTDLTVARRQNEGHHLGVNLQSVRGNEKDNIEFRTFDSSLKPAAIQAQIGIALLLTEGALREDTATIPASSPSPRGQRYDANPRRNNLSGEAWHESTRGFRKFIDKFALGSEDERTNPRIKQLVSVFAMTKWQKAESDWY